MSRTKLAALAAASLLTVALAAPAAAGAGGACSRGVGWDAFELPASDAELIDELTAKYPSVARALNAEPPFYTEEEAIDGFRSVDRNGNEQICIKDVFEHSNASLASQGFFYYVSTVDDNIRAKD
jgi:hypothetical protein